VTERFAWPQGYALRHLQEIDSTNEEARRLARGGAPAPFWIVADRQTRGRGRRGRKWESSGGNLFATLLIDPQRSIAQCSQLSFAAAICVAELVGRYAPNAQVRVKWPNDVLADDRKIAGILLESASSDGLRPDWLAIGFGVNLAAHPANMEFPSTSLAALGASVPSAGEALACLARIWSEWYDVWTKSGFAPIRDAWLLRAARLGARVQARLARGDATGVFEGIDESGALLLRECSGGLRTISAGEVFF